MLDRCVPGFSWTRATRNINGINVGESTDYPDRFRNLKAQLYWALRERFQNGQVSGLDDDLMITQLASIRFEINPRGLIEIESKDAMAKRGIKSPDRAEALMLCFANRTPGIIEYYHDLNEADANYEKAVQEAIAANKPVPSRPNPQDPPVV